VVVVLPAAEGTTMDGEALQARLGAAFEQAPGLMAVMDPDRFRLLALNRAGREMIGDRPIGVSIRTWADLLGQQMIERFEEVRDSGGTYQGTEWRMEWTGPDGSPVEKYLNYTITCVLDAAGRPWAMLGIAQDVTETVKTRDAALEQSARLEAQYLHAADMVAQLQDAMLPKGLPLLQGVQVSARYLLANDEAAAGGDWFDAMVLDSGRLVLSIGDVVGHGVAASATMGELRTIFDDRVRETEDLTSTFDALHRRALRVPEARAATLCAAVLDPRTGDLEYVTAGHPPPVRVERDGHASFLPATGAAPLGSDDGTFPAARHHLEVGELVLLYSDGLVERPGRTPSRSTVELLHVVADTFRGTGPISSVSTAPVVDRVCRQTLELLTRITGYSDDITLLAAQRVAPTPPLEVRLPVRLETVRTARVRLDDWLSGLHMSDLDMMALELAVGELVTNSVEHGYDDPDPQAEVVVSAELRDDGVVEVNVVDDGRWAGEPSAPQHEELRGRGLAMARSVADEFSLEHDTFGTRARVRLRPNRPIELLRGVSTRSGADERVGIFDLTTDDDRVVLAGVVDHEAADLLRVELARSSRGSTREVTLDLSAVTLLSSVAVQVLVEAMADGDVRLVAPVGSAAQHVLDLVQLPYSL
jgi:serine phosphatase RsbU (regulator of sigma subunit)/anti-sigma regulatory factor (Ser/Thr protein kinase)